MAKLLRRLRERHVRRDGGVDDRFAALDADDAIQIARRVVEEADGHGLGAGRDPGALRLGVDVEDVGEARENRLFPVCIFVLEVRERIALVAII